MGKWSLQRASIFCLAIWVLIWILFVLIRFSSLDIRGIPGIGPFMLLALGTALLAPVVAMVLAGAAIIRQPSALLNWLALACAVAVFFGQGLLFSANKWL